MSRPLRATNIVINAIASAVLLSGCKQTTIESTHTANEQNQSIANPAIWPTIDSEVPQTEAVEQRVQALLARMTLEEKVGQMIQPEIAFVNADDIRRYNIGSVLNGGGSFPGRDKRATPQDWVALADEFYEASTDTSDGGVGIPLIWGSDAVHGHNNVYGATIFPHNIGLGAANNPELMRTLGEVTAKEVLVTGLDWTFAPTVAVVRDDRWGRTYESYSEHPEIVQAYASEVVHGIQGVYADGDFLGEQHLLANAKHFLGDGGTVQGRDQGDNLAEENVLRDIHAPGYFSALEAGVQIVMTSFSSWQGQKLHGHKGLVTDVLKKQMGFDGFVISDWNGHQQIPGCTQRSCAAAINAGIDMVMVTEQWRPFIKNTLKQVRTGEIPLARIDDAVTRILRVKIRAGVLDAPRPSARPYSGKTELLGHENHRAAARQAVRESLVLLKNNHQTLPIKANSHVIVLGNGADNIGKQSGGWTLSWQGTGNSNDDFPNGDSIFDGIAEAITAGGGKAELFQGNLSDLTSQPDAAIIVFGEDPYAEFQGDRQHLAYADAATRNQLQQLRELGIPSVAVFLSGRPMYATDLVNRADAFVAAWLPGTEGGGVADVIIGNRNGQPRFDFKGQLSFSWPDSPFQVVLNVGDDDYAPLFAYGYGLSYQQPQELAQLPEADLNGVDLEATPGVLFTKGRTMPPWKFFLSNTTGSGTIVSGTEIHNEDRSLIGRLADRHQQGDSQSFAWSGSAKQRVMMISHDSQDFLRESNGNMSLAMDIKVSQAPQSPFDLTIGCGEGCRYTLDISEHLSAMANDEWQTLRLPLQCFQSMGARMDSILSIEWQTQEQFEFTLSELKLAEAGLQSMPCQL